MNANKLIYLLLVIGIIVCSCFMNCANDKSKNETSSQEVMITDKELNNVELPKCISKKLVKPFGTFYSVVNNFCDVQKPNEVIIEIESSKSIMDNKTHFGFSINVFSKKRYNSFIPDNQYQVHILRTASETVSAKDYNVDPYIPENTNLYNCLWKHTLDVTEIESKKAMTEFIQRGPVYCRIPGTNIEFKITNENILNLNKLFSENWDVVE